MFKQYVRYFYLIISTALIISLGLNWYLLTNKPAPIIRTIKEIKEVEKVKVVTKVETRFITRKVSGDVTNLTEKDKAALLDQISKEELKIETAPVLIVEDQDGSIFISETITGSATLEPFIWAITVDLKVKEIYRQPVLPVDLGYMLALNNESDIGVVVSVPFLPNLDAMAGIKSYSVCYTTPFTKNASWRLGILNTYSGTSSLAAGLRFKLF